MNPNNSIHFAGGVFHTLIGVFMITMIACKGQDQTQNTTLKASAVANNPVFTLGVLPVSVPDSLPFLQSFAWATYGTKLLLIGGRIEGFHGLSELDTVFKTSKANTAIQVIDLADYSYDEMPLNTKDAKLLQLASSNMEFFQDGDTLYLVGGFGIRAPGSVQSNYTFPRLISLSVREMINQVESESGGDPYKAIINMASSPFLQVAGGELVKDDNTFYLMFGQNYQGAYNTGKNGVYTGAIRKFRLGQGQIVDTSSYIDPMLLRRDLPLAPVVQQSGNLYAAFGGVFTPDDDGYVNPVLININNGSISATQDTLIQITNQYDCARAVIYDPVNNFSTTVLFGGIGANQYNRQTKKWEHGDDGAKLPFVKTITQMIFQNGNLSQYIQLPPQNPELPEYIGANAIFIPDTTLLYAEGILDYQKITSDTASIGIIYGGIKSSRPTSSNIYPTSTNNTVYEVFLYRMGPTKK